MEKEIVVIGGGFAGINFVQSIANHQEFHVTLVDVNNYNFFPPLLYQVATGFLETSNISYPFRKLLQGKRNVNFRLGELSSINTAENKVVLSTGELSFDYLVLATGTETNYFGNKNIEKNALPMKTVNDAIHLRNFLLMKLEEATLLNNKADRERYTTIVIAGGGPTGVEVAGMLAEMRRDIVRKDYPEFTSGQAPIYLVDGGPKVLAPMSEESQKYTYDRLIKLGVEVKLNKLVKDYVDNTITFADGDQIQTNILIWAAGVTSKVFEGIPKESYGRGRRLLVNEYNQITGMANIFAIGDTCLQTTDPDFPQGHPQLAQVAIQQGQNLANNLIAQFQNKPLKPFAYHDKGSMAIIGRNQAVADFPKPKMHFKGFIAWLMWIFIHLISLINYRNRFKTLFNWMGSYFTKDQSLRMIIRPENEKKEHNTDPKPLEPQTKI